MAEVRWTDQASDDLASHAEYIAKDRGTKGAQVVVKPYEITDDTGGWWCTVWTDKLGRDYEANYRWEAK